jgi:hypothetical protein
MKLRERVEATSQARCSLTNPGVARKATLRAAGIERCAGLVNTSSGSRASRSQAKASLRVEDWLRETTRGSGGVMAAARKDWVVDETGEALLAPERKTRERLRRQRQSRRPEGGCWAHSSGEALVTRRDSAKSRRMRTDRESARIAKERPRRSRREPSWPRFREQGEAGRP